LKPQQRNDAWTSTILAGLICTYYMLLKKHDNLYGTNRVIDYAIPKAAVDASVAAAADLSKTTTSASASGGANPAADSLSPPAAADLEVKATLA
jgi:hypothetical protein